MGEQTSYSLSEAVEENSSGIELSYFSKEAFAAVLSSKISTYDKTKLFANLARYNTLYMIARAGSGHLGSSFSSLDLVSWLYINVLNSGDKYFSSKGHDAPGLYSVQAALNILPFDKIHMLRRLNGLTGHPDVNTPGSFTNTGSLGMGVSKAKGFIYADDFHNNDSSNVFVLTGDGELQEGHFWESLVSASNNYTNRITVIVDHNKIQSDTFVSDVSDLGDLESKFHSFGWEVLRIDGHDFKMIESAVNQRKDFKKPLAIIADTVKGKGVSFMEHLSMEEDQEYYTYHSGAPNLEEYKLACEELSNQIFSHASEQDILLPKPTPISIDPIVPPENAERMIPAYTESILDLAEKNKNLVALDADLVLDTGLIPFKEKFPDRFIECGIAEQDMVSQAGTMALSGLIPIVHSFACFLISRASEQIYNNASQNGKVIYVGSLSGVLPGGPGHSHQAVRDIAGMLSMPGMTILEPLNASQVNHSLKWAVEENNESSYLRLTSIPYEQSESLKNLNSLVYGQGHVITEGLEIALIVFGPVFSYLASEASSILQNQGLSVKVIATPWINKVDLEWLENAIGNTSMIATLENHYTESGAGSVYISKMASSGLLKDKKVLSIGLDELPVCGRNEEVLDFHGLLPVQIAEKISKCFKKA
ncbi:transketolase [Gammaproteobacteria bacterium]|jgi:transketolase|nr:transketolase [Gammaproteobacteria bacterium]